MINFKWFSEVKKKRLLITDLKLVIYFLIKTGYNFKLLFTPDNW